MSRISSTELTCLIIKLLMTAPATREELEKSTGTTQKAIFRHLNKLYDQGLIYKYGRKVEGLKRAVIWSFQPSPFHYNDNV